MKLKLARFGSWPSLCVDGDAVLVENRNGHSRKRLIKTKSINESNSLTSSLTENYNGNVPVNRAASSNFIEKIDKNDSGLISDTSLDIDNNNVENCCKPPISDNEISLDITDGCQLAPISEQLHQALIENLQNFSQSTTSSVTTPPNYSNFTRGQESKVMNNFNDSSKISSPDMVTNGNYTNGLGGKYGKDEKLSKLDLLSGSSLLESPQYLSIIEEKDENLTDSHRSKDEPSTATIKNSSDVAVNSPEKRRQTTNALLHRLSVPDMSSFVSRYRSVSSQDVSSRDDNGEGFVDSETENNDRFDEICEEAMDDDDDVDERNAELQRRQSECIGTENNALVKRRNFSVSSLGLNRNSSSAVDRRRVSHCAGENVGVDDGRDDHCEDFVPPSDMVNKHGFLVHPSAAALKANFDRSMSASTPSIAAEAVGSGVKVSTQAGEANFNDKNTGIVDQEFGVIRRNSKVKHTRTPSLYVPSITPRLPLMGLLPGSVRRISDKSENKVKDKEKRSFFRPRAKSKEKKPHFWIKVVCSNSDVCEMCTKPLANTDAYQCNECLTSVHSQCKDQVEKTSCAKMKHPKIAKASSHMSMSFPEKPKNLVNRYSSLKIEPILTHRSESTQNLFPVEEKSNANHPPGFSHLQMGSVWDELELWSEEPEAWSATSVGKLEKKKLPSKEVKRQDIIHEMYVTEKHHCQVLVVLKHTYFDGIAAQKLLPAEDLTKLLPGLDDLLNVHHRFLRLFKQRRDEAPVVGLFHDVLLEQFTGETAELMIETYTKFCALKDTTDRMFQELYQNNTQYQNFVKSVSSSAFYKSRSLCDCLLLITQRLSKYHSFVENIRKHTLDDCPDKEGIHLAEKAVKDLVKAVDDGIEKVQLQKFRFNIAKEMDPKISVPFDKTTFSVKDLISDTRSLLFYAEVQWPNAKRHTATVLLLLFSDVIVFIQRNNGQCNFYGQDGKACVVSVKKMIVRDKAGKLGSDGVYLIATFPKPEMYEVRCKTRKENVLLMSKIQKAVERYTNENIVQEEVVAKPSSSLSSRKEVVDLRDLFNKLPDVHKKLLSNYDELLNVYESISNYISKLAPKLKNNEDKEKIASLVNNYMESYLSSIRPDSVALEVGVTAKEKLQQQMEFLQCEDNGSDSGSNFSSDNAVLRSHTFHGRLGNSIRRRALRKHQTILGVSDMDNRPATADSRAVFGGSSCESISEDGEICGSTRSNNFNVPVNDVTFSVLKRLTDTKVEIMNLRENNARLECELALANDVLQQRSRQSAAIDNNYQRLEELRNLHASFDKKKNDDLHDIEEKKVQLSRRERSLDEREATFSELQRRDEELHERWSKLVHVWEQQRANGLPVSPLTSAMAPMTTANGELRRAYSVLSPSNAGVTIQQQQQYAERIQQQRHASPNVTMATPSVAKQPQPSNHVSPPGVVPGHLQGSLVHLGRYPVEETPKTVLPVKLIKEYSVTESLSSKFGRGSHKKKSGTSKSVSTSKLADTPAQQQQLIPNKLASGEMSNKKK